MHGSVIGTNLGQIIYGADLNDQRREQMVRYLTRLANVKETLRLHGLAGKLDKGLNLPDVYVMLATTQDTRYFLGNISAKEQYEVDVCG